MFAALSYGSFSAGAGRQGGWSIGEQHGVLDPELQRKIVAMVPTSLSDGTPQKPFPNNEELAQRVHRFMYLTKAFGSHHNVFYASVPAGDDSSGRPGNVYTYIAVTDAALQPQEWMYSPQIPTPYRSKRTDNASIPEGPISQPGVVADRSVVARLLDGEKEAAGEYPVEFAHVKPVTESRWGTYATLMEQVEEARAQRQQVVVVAHAPECALWAAALWHGLDSQLSMSSFERANSVSNMLAQGVEVVCVPAMDYDAVIALGLGGVRVVDTRETVARGDTQQVREAFLAGERATPMPEAFKPEEFLGGNAAPSFMNSPFADEPQDSAVQISNPFDVQDQVSTPGMETVEISLEPHDYEFLEASTQAWSNALSTTVGSEFNENNRDRIMLYLALPYTNPLGKRARVQALKAMLAFSAQPIPASAIEGLSAQDLDDVKATVVEEYTSEGLPVGSQWHARCGDSQLRVLLQEISEQIARRDPLLAHRASMQARKPRVVAPQPPGWTTADHGRTY
ncbi:Uncharacterised protein [Corynebacterium renale]|uniref:GAP1-N2 domain-containing protein n=1 Tax=Corynebacterium renale TaxID=1724 RepID=UPI000DA2A9CC|nr:hypothetical protein [Corynebacterium renale]SQG63569.1 Uncharacterised protein [Corynebacterium renale]STD00950.1 Uncharacterised protein [Corynebacterium renale]